MENASGTRLEVIISPSGMTHSPKVSKITGAVVRRWGWRITACGQFADSGWTQRRRFGYVECRTCLRLLERSP